MEDCCIMTVDSGLLDGGLLYSDGGLVISTVDSGFLGGGLLYPDSGFWNSRWKTIIYIPTVDSGLLDGGRLYPGRGFWTPRWRTATRGTELVSSVAREIGSDTTT